MSTYKKIQGGATSILGVTNSLEERFKHVAGKEKLEAPRIAVAKRARIRTGNRCTVANAMNTHDPLATSHQQKYYNTLNKGSVSE